MYLKQWKHSASLKSRKQGHLEQLTATDGRKACINHSPPWDSISVFALLLKGVGKKLPFWTFVFANMSAWNFKILLLIPHNTPIIRCCRDKNFEVLMPSSRDFVDTKFQKGGVYATPFRYPYWPLLIPLFFLSLYLSYRDKDFCVY